MSEPIEYRLTAKDEASAEMEKVVNSLKKVAQESTKTSETMDKGSTSWKDIAKGVFAGGAALDLAKQGFNQIKSVITDSIAEASEYERTQAQLNAVLASTKGAAGLSIEELNNMAGELSNLTAVDDDVISSMQALQLTFTNISKETFKETSLAALDMATAMNGGVLPSAEQVRAQMIQLGKAMQNPKEGAAALTRVGVNLTQQQKDQIETMLANNDVMGAQKIILGELSTEFGGSAAAAANTFEGRMSRLHNAIGDVKKVIGQALLPTLSIFIDGATDATGKINVNENAMGTWQLRIYQVATIIKGIIGTIANFARSLFDLGRLVFEVAKFQIDAWAGVVKAIQNFGNVAKTIFKAIKEALSGNFDEALTTLKNSFKDTFSAAIASFGNVEKAAARFGQDMAHNFDPMAEAINEAMDHKKFDVMMASMKEAEGKAKQFNQAVTPNFNGVSKEAGDMQKKVKDSLDSLGKQYETSVNTAENKLADLEASHAEKTASISSKISELQGQLKELEDTYKNTIGEINKTEAERVIEQEAKIAEMKKQLAEETAKLASSTGGDTSGGQAKIGDLEGQLAKEQAAYDAYIKNRTGLDAELSEARRRAGLTDFERFIEDTEARRSKEEETYKAKQEALKNSIVEQQVALGQEQVIFEVKKQMYQEQIAAIAAWHDSYVSSLQNMSKETEKSVGQMKAKLEEMMRILASIEDAKTKAGISTAAGFSQPAPGPAPGGALFGSGGGGSTNQTVSINLGGVTVNSEADMDKLVKEIIRQLQLAKVGSQ